MPNPLEGLITRQDIADIAERESLILNDEDRISILESMRSIDVQACPGSGKSTLIATKLILLAKKWPLSQQGVCVLSHTNVAKDEIILRLKKTKIIEAQRLLSYPHFIGTIQEFVNRFLGLPYLRSMGVRDITVDNDEYVKAARMLMENVQFAWFSGTLNGLGAIDKQDEFLRGTFRLCTDTGTDTNINKTPRAWRQQNNFQRAKRSLELLKSYLDQRGFYLFRDMYTQAQIVSSLNERLRSSVAKRFPYIFIDEMQDTQKFQDELLSQLFPLDAPTLIIQRFGDPDQAIFNGISGGEEPNESYNRKSADNMDFVINASHRFDSSIAEKIKNLSYNEILLETELSGNVLAERIQNISTGRGFEHTIIIYCDQTRGDVISAFADIVSLQFSANHKSSDKFSVKVVGAVGNEIDPNGNQLKIGHYWDNYDKSKSKSNFKEGSLIEAVRYCRQGSSCDWAANHRLITGCILRLLRKADKRDENGRYFSATTQREFLKNNEMWDNYRKLIHTMLGDAYLIDEVTWGDIRHALSAIIGLNPIPAEAIEYLAFHEEGLQGTDPGAGVPRDALESLPENMILHPDGFKVEISTIHAVKGETHDATLILETKNHCFDLETMIPYLTKDLPSDENPNGDLRPSPSAVARFKPNQKFMRQFYVAMSRPKHLLCLAIHSDRISTVQKAALEELGWNVRELPLPAPEETR
jgi:DNA helicase II / ATP-dependent DNA helicase PcrA